jgi:hypothetical protein
MKAEAIYRILSLIGETQQLRCTYTPVISLQSCLNRVILECDNLSLINMLRAGNGDRSAAYGLWQEIQELGRSFVSVEFSFVYREGNGAAHVCASLPSSLETELVWLDNFPLRLVEAIGADCNPAVI